MHIRLTRHAIERYVDRVRPGLGIPEAEAELEQLVRIGQVLADAPPWYHGNARKPAAYLVAGDVLVPLNHRGLALTVVVREPLRPDELAARREEKARRRRKRRYQRSRRDEARRPVRL